MRFIAAGLVIATCIVSAALAQDATPPAAERPPLLFDMQPDGRAYARNYPRQAMYRDQNGVAILCCMPRADRTLDCTAPLEWPQGAGFGEATLAISGEFRLDAASYAEVQAHPERLPIRRTINWTMSPRTPEFDQASLDMRARFDEVCPMNQPAPSANGGR